MFKRTEYLRLERDDILLLHWPDSEQVKVRMKGMQIITIVFAFVRMFHVRKVPPNQRDDDDVEDDFCLWNSSRRVTVPSWDAGCSKSAKILWTVRFAPADVTITARLRVCHSVILVD